jgi:serine/threonine-protein kinase RsbT
MTLRRAIVLNKEKFTVNKEPDTILIRQKLKEHASKIKMGLVNQTKLITAGSELVRNLLKYGGGGEVTIEVISLIAKTGVRVTFSDKGPGIADINQALQEGFSTTRSLGLGLPGAKKLVNEFNIESEVGNGTTVTIVKWKDG